MTKPPPYRTGPESRDPSNCGNLDSCAGHPTSGIRPVQPTSEDTLSAVDPAPPDAEFPAWLEELL